MYIRLLVPVGVSYQRWWAFRSFGSFGIKCQEGYTVMLSLLSVAIVITTIIFDVVVEIFLSVMPNELRFTWTNFCFKTANYAVSTEQPLAY